MAGGKAGTGSRGTGSIRKLPRAVLPELTMGCSEGVETAAAVVPDTGDAAMSASFGGAVTGADSNRGSRRGASAACDGEGDPRRKLPLPFSVRVPGCSTGTASSTGFRGGAGKRVVAVTGLMATGCSDGLCVGPGIGLDFTLKPAGTGEGAAGPEPSRKLPRWGSLMAELEPGGGPDCTEALRNPDPRPSGFDAEGKGCGCKGSREGFSGPPSFVRNEGAKNRDEE